MCVCGVVNRVTVFLGFSGFARNGRVSGCGGKTHD